MGAWYKERDLWLGLLGFGGLVAGLQLAGFNPVGQVAAQVRDVFSKGSRLSYGTLDHDKGVIRENPETLRQAASARFGTDLDRDLYAASRMVRSEGATEGAVRVHVALNDLDALGWPDLFTLLTYSTDPQRKGIYGQQSAPAFPPQYPKAMVRRYATSKDPYEGDVRTAQAAISDHAAGIDPTNGAVKFVDRSSFGVQAGTSSFDALVQRWASDGLHPYTLPEYGDDLVLFKKGDA